MNTSVNTTSTISISLTKPELWIQLVVFYGILCGLVANILNLLTWIGILRKNEMRTRFFILVAFLGLCRTGICSQILTLAFYRSLRTVGVVNLRQPRLVCHTIHFWLINGYTLELTLLGTLLVERAVALLFPKFYYRVSKKSVYFICGAQYLIVSTAKLVPSYLEDMLGPVDCINLYSFLSHSFNDFTQIVDLVLTILILVVYCMLILYVRWKSTKAKQSTNGVNEAEKIRSERHAKLMPILRTLVLFHCIFTLLGKFFAFLSGKVEPQYSQRLVACSGVFICLDQFANAVTLVVTNKDIRYAAMPWLKRNHVEGMSKIDQTRSTRRY